MQSPSAAHEVVPTPQVPQLPPQPSSPHCLPAQSGVHEEPSTHRPAGEQTRPTPQMPQLPPQPSSPHPLLAQSGVQTDGSTHCPSKEQVSPIPHTPQLTPQPLSPHSRVSQTPQHGSSAGSVCTHPSLPAGVQRAGITIVAILREAPGANAPLTGLSIQTWGGVARGAVDGEGELAHTEGAHDLLAQRRDQVGAVGVCRAL